MELDLLIERVDSKETFLNFLAALRADLAASRAAELIQPSSPYTSQSGGWENPQLEAFLEAMQAWTEDMGDRVPASASWQTFARMFIAAKIYE